MTQPIKNFVDVVISRETAAVQQAAFGVPLIVGVHSAFAERIQILTNPTAEDVLALGFVESDVEYKMFLDLNAQELKPNKVAFGRADATVQGEYTLSPDAAFVADNVIEGTINGEAISVPFNTDDATTLSDLASAIAGLSTVASAVVNTGDIDIVFVDSVAPSVSAFTVTGGASQAVITVTETVAAVTLQSSLSAIALESEEFYAILLESTSEGDILGAAEWVEAKEPKKLLFVRTSSADVYGSGSDDIASQLKALGYDRTIVNWHSGADQYLDAAIVGRMLPEDPGSATFNFKSLSGIADFGLANSQIGLLKGKNANLYSSAGGQSFYQDGKVASGEWIDVMIGVDWIEARMAERIFALLLNAKKVPLNNAGIAQIETEIRAQLEDSFEQGIINDDYTVVVPLASELSAADKAARRLTGITWTATLQGAIHKVEIRGTVTL